MSEQRERQNAYTIVCQAPGCNESPATGSVLRRISPKGKGQKFEGLCDEHYRVWVSSAWAREEW